MSEAMYAEERTMRDQSEVEREVVTLEELEQRLGKAIALHRERLCAYLRNEAVPTETMREVAQAPRTSMGERLASLRERISQHVASLADLTSLFEG
jgi:succinate dehydrogenase/fumarate reductase flavoprotein subunit